MGNHLRTYDPVFGTDFDAALRRFFAPMPFDADAVPQLSMRIDVAETGGGWQVKADIPGVKKEDINVRVDGNIVHIDAESRREKEEKGNGSRVLRSERYYGTISRTFSVGDDIDEARVEAKYADGVLVLQLPRKAAPASKKVTVQ